MKYLGIDFGRSKIGLAVGDDQLRIASPFQIVSNDANLFDTLKQICQSEEIDKIIIGVPLGLKGNRSEQYQQVEFFIKNLRQAVGIDIIEEDEKLSTAYAKTLLQGQKKKRIDDDVAAMIILQSYLDRVS